MENTMRRIKGAEADINFLDVTLLVYFCVLYAHQDESLIGTALRYGSLLLIFVMYSIYYLNIWGQCCFRKTKIGYFVIWISLFVVYCTLSMFWSINTSDVWASLSNLLKNYIGCMIIIPRLHSREHIYRTLKIMLIAIIYMLLVLIIKTPLAVWGSARVGLIINQNANDVGRIVNVGMLLCLFFITSEKKGRLLYAVVMMLFAVCAIMTGSKTALIIMVFQLGLFYFLISGTGKKIATVFIALLSVVLVFWLIMTNPVLYELIGVRFERMFDFLSNTDYDGSTGERLAFMQMAWSLFKQKPIIGVGMNNFRSYLKMVGYSNAVYSHSGVFEILSTLGLTGFVLYYGFVARNMIGLYKLVRKKDKMGAVLFTMLVTIVICEISMISMYMPNTYFILMFSYCYLKIPNRNRETTGSMAIKKLLLAYVALKAGENAGTPEPEKPRSRWLNEKW